MASLNWTANEIAIIRDLYPTTRTADMMPLLPGRKISQVQAKANDIGANKTKETIRRMAREAILNPNHKAHSSKFKKGHKTWNAGMKGFKSGGRSAETQFKPGRKPHSWKPIGSERLTKDGYLQRKMTDTGYPPRDWVFVHHLIWKEAGNDIPQGFALRFKDGNNKNITLDNLELLSRRQLMAKNSVHNYGPEIAKIVQLRGAISRQINKRTKKESANV